MHISGVDNHLPDFLSRADCIDSAELKVNLSELVSSVDWEVEQKKDAEIKRVIELIEGQSSDADWINMSDGRRWLHERKNLYVVDKILKHGRSCLVVPHHMKDQVLKLHHDSPFVGHRAYETVLESLKSRYYWNYMPSEVRKYCLSCHSCQSYNYANIHHKAPLKPIMVTRPWQLVGMDFMGPFNVSTRGNRYIILSIDHFTKFAIGAATVSFDAETTARFLLDEIVCRYGMVEKILTDQGVNFESNMLKHLCILLNTKKLHTSAYHASGNGITERLNKSIKPNLAKCVNESHTDWDLYLQMAISAYNNSHHATIKMTPYEAMFARQSVSVADVIMSNQLPSDTKLAEILQFTKTLRARAAVICQKINENTEAAQFKQKVYHDKFVKNNKEFKLNDIVKINNYKHTVGLSRSFEKKFIGP